MIQALRAFVEVLDMLGRRLVLLLGGVSLSLAMLSAHSAEASTSARVDVIEHYGLEQSATPVK